MKNGKEENVFVVGCETHNFWYKGMPPLTHGCAECWHSYFFGRWAETGAKQEQVDQLESVIRHAAELAEKGEFDFKPDYEMKIENETN